MDKERMLQLRDLYRTGLLEDVVPFWLKNSVDREYGGTMTALDRDGTVIDTDKCLWQQGRFAWLLGHMHNTIEQRDEWLDVAGSCVRFIMEHGLAPNGQLYFLVERDGRPLRRRRYAFSESFAAMAMAEYARATGKDEYAAKARLFFTNFAKFHGNASATGIPEKMEPARRMRGIGFPMIRLNVAQTLREALGDESFTRAADESIETIAKYHVKDDIQCVMESVGPNGEIVDHSDGRTLNPGHAIEGAWFVLYEAKRRGNDPGLIALGTKMLDWMWHRGWDEEYGGLLYFRDVRGLPVQEYWHDMKFWWPQNEAIIATLLAYQLTGDAKYARWHAMVHDWSYAHFSDPEHGEWYGYLHRDGRIASHAKGTTWKGCFHLPRMQLVCWRILDEMLAGG
jgi:N-acylglucosamine 2-epimerase